MNSEWESADEFSLDLRVRYVETPAVSAGMVTQEPNCGAGTSRATCPGASCD
ncbi:hypothetical protein ACQEU8_07055 [Streptomyces sp. CA-250714]|uniref:hypothetical protein n=1 Tax=Streptomyces sp. CA-250714 TaxID=3240060 RepID=UPI003D9379EE